MMERLRLVINTTLVVGLLALGGGVMTWLVNNKPVPPTRGTRVQLLAVAISVVEPRVEQLPVVGYGSVRPKNQVQIVPQVSGKLIYAAKNLAQGKIIPRGDLLFEIDATVYDARVRQSDAEIRGLQAAVGRQDQELTNLDERIANVEQMVTIDESDYLTSKRLFEVDNVGTRRSVDVVYQKYLVQRDVLVDLKNKRAMIPHLKLETQAELEAARARLSQAQHSLENTKIFCPFKARVESVSAHTSQVVTAHFSIATLTDMEAFEISVGIDPRELRWLARAVRPPALEQETDLPRPPVNVTWSLPGQEFSWRGYVTRFERVDEVTRTARMVIEVRDVDMTASVDFGNSDSTPTLSIGMYCRAELPAEPLADALLVPRHAVYEDRWVYVYEPATTTGGDASGRLGRREIPMLRTMGDEVLVDYRGRDDAHPCELKDGDLLIVSPLIKPVVGMKITLQEESKLALLTHDSPELSLLDRLAEAKLSPIAPSISAHIP